MAGVVIGIAGAPGSGKSTVTRALAAALGDATAIHMDSYERMTRQGMEEIAAWAARGGDPNELPVPLLHEHLAALKAGQAVTDPATGATLRPARYIVFETQFGRDHCATGEHIDLLAWIDTPREVALARTVRQGLADALAAPPAQQRERIAWLQGYVENYLALVRQLLVRQRERVLPGADLVLDATTDLAGVVDRLRTEVERRFAART